jgi:hypothetical protein
MAYPTPSPAGFLNNNARLGSDASVLKLEDYANMQAANYMLTPWKSAVAPAANELAVSEPQVIAGSGGHGGDVDVWSMLSVDQTRGRDGAKRVHQPRMFATTPALKRGQYNPDAASQLYSAPHTRISRAGGDITEVQSREIGLASEADHARLAGLGTAIDMFGVGTGESTRGSYDN